MVHFQAIDHNKKMITILALLVIQMLHHSLEICQNKFKNLIKLQWSKRKAQVMLFTVHTRSSLQRREISLWTILRTSQMVKLCLEITLQIMFITSKTTQMGEGTETSFKNQKEMRPYNHLITTNSLHLSIRKTRMPYPHLELPYNLKGTQPMPPNKSSMNKTTPKTILWLLVPKLIDWHNSLSRHNLNNNNNWLNKFLTPMSKALLNKKIPPFRSNFNSKSHKIELKE